MRPDLNIIYGNILFSVLKKSFNKKVSIQYEKASQAAYKLSIP
jgi:hypothetical protein